jgi:hypothetical protein
MYGLDTQPKKSDGIDFQVENFFQKIITKNDFTAGKGCGVGEGQIQLVKNFFTGNDHLRQSFFRGFECAKS